uniref:Transmembrane protein n=1 Tax=Panagrellus redivivus TaxID=6233 RepID=A0A7E4W7Q4_PANRE
MGCFANLFRYFYAFLAVVAILILVIITNLPLYYKYCADDKCEYVFFMNPAHTRCGSTKELKCPGVYLTSLPHWIITGMYAVIVPILLVCAALNFVTACLCCPFGPAGVTTATGISTLLCLIAVGLSFAFNKDKKLQYPNIKIKVGPTVFLGVFEVLLLLAMTIVSSFASFLSSLCL